MSARDWAFCPQCARKRKAERKAFEKKVRDSYGKISSEEYLKLVKKLNTPEKPEETFREDYEIGLCTDETFFVSYHGRCTQDGCGFSFEFKEERKLPLSE